MNTTDVTLLIIAATNVPLAYISLRLSGESAFWAWNSLIVGIVLGVVLCRFGG